MLRATRPRRRASACGCRGPTRTRIGWLRYTLDERRIPYSYVRDEDVRAGKLHDKYDVLLYGHVDLELAEQIQGIPKVVGPDAVQEDEPDAEPRHAGLIR